MNPFGQLGLSSSVTEIINKLGFEKPTPIQQKAIPLLLENDPTDFIGLAQTGTGKTAAFGLPLIDLIDVEDSATQALIMAPTRELGQQTAQQLVSFASNNDRLNVEVVYGGANISTQIKALRRPTQIIVATPGRLLDLINRKSVKLGEVRYVVLDEADEMLNMGFKEAIDEILSHIPEERAIWLFSATMPPDIRRIVKKYMEAPKEVTVNSAEKSNKDISHQFIVTKTAHKIAALRRFLDLQPDMRGIMFCRTKRETQQIAEDLGDIGYGVEALHGDLSQGQRDAVMKRFKNRSMQLLIATDVAARGIDVNNLTHVIHHTLPDQLESYTHRSGRTGRAGKKGISLAFINPREGRRITELEKSVNVTFEKVDVPSMEELKSKRIHHWANLIINTKVDDQADNILESLGSTFEELTKEDLLKRLITTQLDHLMVQGEVEDLNEHKESSRRDKRSEKKDTHRYFINIGSMDGVTKGDLVHFISDIARIDRNFITGMNLQKTCAFFDVDKSKDKGFGDKFKGVEVEGRYIRVNRDDDARGSGGRGKGDDKPNRNRSKRKKSGDGRSRKRRN